MKGTYFLFVIIILLAFNKSCICNKEPCPEYFELPFTTYPKSIEYKIGDTIHIASKFHRRVPAYGYDPTLKYIGDFDMQGINWYPSSVIYKLDTVREKKDFSLFEIDFKYLEDPGVNYHISQSSSGSIGLLGEYKYINDTFYLSYNIICLKKGLYLMYNSNELIPHSTGMQNFPGKCGLNGIRAWTNMNKGMMNNVELLLESPDPHWNNWLYNQEIDNKLFTHLGGYCFKVVE